MIQALSNFEGLTAIFGFSWFVSDLGVWSQKMTGLLVPPILWKERDLMTLHPAKIKTDLKEEEKSKIKTKNSEACDLRDGPSLFTSLIVTDAEDLLVVC